MRDLRTPLVCLIAALALSGGMGPTSPVTGDPALDSMAYGQPSFATPVAYAEPAPSRGAYNLGPGDKLHVVVDGQEGLTYVPNTTVESAVAIASGFSPRAKRDQVTLTHTDASGTDRFVIPAGTPIGPGDTVFVGERWF
ncbi:protein involved in polysaccharide export with SLBB domain [Bradyrhizobium sp. i1.8.4]|uniref:hypothetical protein n=1 Tax=unclassified Bradyrhizobium TaxID=2631580 RepID=UPI003D20E221